MKSGIVVLKKEEGITSQGAVNRVKRLFAEKKAGHTGTLDPLATGVLPVLIGRAVKASEYMLSSDKFYRATLKLGLTTDTEDITGEVLTESGVVVRISEVIAVAMDDAPGGAGGILHLLSEAGLNVEYMYACVGRLSGKALMVIRTDDAKTATDVLHRNGYGDINPAEVYRI